MKDLVLARYGIGYVPAPQIILPSSPPLWVDDGRDHVQEHIDWCISKMTPDVANARRAFHANGG
jgi:hypothetical protein